jgi:YVTN family beta-propeller protein
MLVALLGFWWLIRPGDLTQAQSSTHVSCLDILNQGASSGDGEYTIDPDGAGGDAPVQVYCDMTTDGGGWTLVGATFSTTLNDQASAYYTDLATLSPTDGHEGIWDGMRPLASIPSTDVRFSCRNQRDTGPFDVDLAFYDVPWYGEFSASTKDADVCFEENNGQGQTLPPPARRDLLTGESRPLGDQWDAGFLEGEDTCGSTDDFTLDLDDRGIDGNQGDGTDWGQDDNVRKCGADNVPSGTWFVWVREPVGVFIDPVSETGKAEVSSTLLYTQTLVNLTGSPDNFDLALSGDTWPTGLSITRTGVLSHGAAVTLTVQVDIPAGATPGNQDTVTLTATSTQQPAVFSNTATLTSTALSGQYGYIFNSDNNEINLVDLTAHLDTDVVIDTTPYGTYPWHGALSPDAQQLYSSLKDSSRVLIIDTVTRAAVASLIVGSNPRGIAFTPSGDYALVANQGNDSITVINTAVPTVTETIAVGHQPTNLATSPCLNKFYVTNQLSDTVSVIDPGTWSQSQVIAGFDGPLDVAISPYGHYAYVLNEGDDSVSVLNPATDSIVHKWMIQGALSPSAIDISPDGKRLYLSDAGTGRTFVLDAFTGQMIESISTDLIHNHTWGLEVFASGAGSFAYASNPRAGNVQVIDTATHRVIKTIPLGGAPREMALFPPQTVCQSGVVLAPSTSMVTAEAGSTAATTKTVWNLTGSSDSFGLTTTGQTWPTTPSANNTGSLAHGESFTLTLEVNVPASADPGDNDLSTLTATSVNQPTIYSDTAILTSVALSGQYGYVFNSSTDEINLVDTQVHVDTGIAIDTTPYGGFPWYGALSPDGKWLYASLHRSDRILMVDTSTHTPVVSITVGEGPRGVAFSPDGSYAFVANQWSNDISVVDTSGRDVTSIIPVQGRPTSLAASSCLDKLYVTNQFSNTVSIIDIPTLTATRVITGFAGPHDVAISPNGNHAYVLSQDASSIAVLDTSSDALTATWPISDAIWLSALDVGPDGQVLYVTDVDAGLVYVLSTQNGQLLETIPAGPHMELAWGLEVFPSGAGHLAYVSTVQTGQVKVIDTTSNSVIHTISLGGNPRGMALFPPASGCGLGPQAAFSPATTSIQVGDTQSWTNQSTGTAPLSYVWNFGDGTPLHVAEHPTHTYVTTGTFTVVLTVTNPIGQDSTTGTVVVKPHALYLPLVLRN